jgi:hypothetical protein
MLQLTHDSLVFSFPDVHPDAKVRISFMRTLRIPDDGKTYPLPPGLSTFPLRLVDDFKDRIPLSWKEHGGVMLPMFQSEAMWLNFSSQYIQRHGAYPFVVKVATGKRSALTGEAWTSELRAKDYCVVPTQPWLDGYVVEKDTIRQFVAAPLGMGFTAEEQITGKAEFGGLQIEVMPMKREVFDRRFPKQETSMLRGMMSLSDQLNEQGASYNMMGFAAAAAAAPDMGLAPGGRMKQEVFEDPYEFSDWNQGHHGRCFVHLTNSLAWRAITKHEPPTVPVTAEDYTSHGLPWFEHYADGVRALRKSLDGTKLTKDLKSVLELGFQKGFSILPENESVAIKSDQVVKLGTPNKDEVRDGKWA